MALPSLSCRALSLSLLLCLAGGGAGAASEEELRAAFVYRFAQFTQWPSALGDLVVCGARLGETEEPLRRLDGRALGAATVRYRRVESPREASTQCQVLVLGHSDVAALRHWVQGLGSASVLVVGLSAESWRAGASIALLTEPHGLAFSVNQSEAQRRGLQVSAQVLKLAREVR
ncbi:YfiR family protein [Inhella gelatinilytica]|uniref:YfiR family protein n=1 Tax=Inhella gelatinilytica TaxID=2795030 RepID=A0A931IXB9_9BURK|nr:YfiR family protein [Inhella gelatinilytica]MBH9552735.1 YfiR family protein [Inhella gelatinilytica]